MPDTISFFGRSGYAARYPQLDLLYEEDFFLRCYMHDVILYSKKSDELNIFEDTVLHLLGDTAYNENEIAEYCCLEKDFVKAILDSLQARGYIKDVNVVTDNGKSYLDPGHKETKDTVSEELYSVLVLPETEEMLPILLQENDEHIYDGGISENNSRYEMIFDRDGAGKEELIKGKFGIKRSSVDNTCKIYPYEIRQLISEYNRTNAKKIKLVQQGSINVSSIGHEVYLHLKCGIQYGLVDQVIVSDGTSVITSVLVQYLKDMCPNYLEQVQKRATEAKSGTSLQLPIRKQKYADILLVWQNIKPIPEAVTPDEQHQRLDWIHQNIIQMHALVEQILNYYLKSHPLPPYQYDVFVTQNAERNERLLKHMAIELGLDSSDAITVLGKLNQQRLRRYQKTEVPELTCVLPLVIATSKLNDLGELRTLGRKRRFFLRDMERLDDSKALRHGDQEVKDVYNDHQQLLITVKTMLKMLLPDCRIDEEKGKDKFSAVEQVSQDRLNAIVSLRTVLGNAFLDRISGNLKEDLLQVSPYYVGDLMPYPMDMVNILYRILENYLRSRSMFIDKRPQTKDEIIEYLQKMIGLDIPSVLCSVNDGMIKAAISDKPASLGAYVLVFFGFLPKEKLQGKVKELSNFEDLFTTIGRIIELRGHGNNIELNLSMHEEEEVHLRNRVFECINKMEKI